MQEKEKANIASSTIEINSPRSLKSCIATSWKFFADCPKQYLNTLWLGMAIGGIGLAIAAYCAATLWAGLAVPYSLYVKSGIPQKEALAMITPSTAAWVAFGVGIVAVVIGTCAFKGKLWVFIRETVSPESKDNSRQRRHAFAIRKSELGIGLAAFAIDLIFGIAAAIFAAGAIVAALYTTPWLLLILIPVYVYLYNIYNVYCVEKLYYGSSVGHALKRSFSLGSRRFGGVLFVTALPSFTTGFLALAVCLPIAVMCFAISANAASVLTGEANGLPTFFPALFIATSAIAFAAASAIMSVNAWPVVLKVASEEAKATAPVEKH